MERRWCAVCCAEQIRKHGRFDGDKGLNRAVTTVAGTVLCAQHNLEALDVGSEVARAVDEAPERVRGMIG